jgi:hypothetical protein
MTPARDLPQTSNNWMLFTRWFADECGAWLIFAALHGPSHERGTIE